MLGVAERRFVRVLRNKAHRYTLFMYFDKGDDDKPFHLLDSHEGIEGKLFTDGGWYCWLIITASLLRKQIVMHERCVHTMGQSGL